MPHAAHPPLRTRQVRIDHHSAVHVAATYAREMGAEYGLTGSLPDRAAALASELAGNIEKHATNGSVFLQPLPPPALGLEIAAADRGPGMADVRRCLTDGYTTSGTLGSGLGAVKRIATRLHIRSDVPEGTVIAARMTADGRPSDAGTGAVCLPAPGEEAYGDGCAFHLDAERGLRTAVVIDGLGHGEAAAKATDRALRTFHDHADEPPAAVVQRMHTALRTTRGAAVGLLRVGPGRAEFCGVGNIRLCVLSGDELRQFDGRPGIVGWNLPTLHTRDVALTQGECAVLFSDGIESRWTRTRSPYLTRLPAELLPAALVQRHRRERDDATVVTVAGTA
ncbi:SpoIIE family protein phosphatase [Streptomyces sp. NPDC054784]